LEFPPQAEATESRPKPLGSGLYEIGGAIHRIIPETGVFLEVDSEIKRGGPDALESYVKRMEEEPTSEIVDALQRSFQDYWETLGKLWASLGLMVAGVAGHIPHTRSWFTLFLKCFYLKPSLVERYLKEITRRNLEYMRLAIDFGAELFYIHGDIADNRGPFISPNLYRRYILPEIKREAWFLHKRGAFAFNSSDGKLWPIIEDYLVESGVDGMMEIQTTAGMDLMLLKMKFGDSICFQGGVDCAFTLTHGSTAEVEGETIYAIKTLSPGGGHILSSSNSIHSGVKPSNYIAMLRAARRYGLYSRRPPLQKHMKL
jgi:uroporphyrinogen-III decarboxylase